jgi:hypothetical protein
MNEYERCTHTALAVLDMFTMVQKRFETTRHFKRTTRDSWALHFRLLISTIYCKLPFYNVESSRNTYSRLDITIILFHTHFRMKNTSQLRIPILALLATRILSKHLLSSDQQAKGTHTLSLYQSNNAASTS